MPETYAEFTQNLSQEYLPNCFDTKVLSIYSGRMGKSDLQHLYSKCTQDKKYNNHISFEADCKKTHPSFSVYEQNGGQGHDAGFDSFMTGLVFATLAKFIEVGNIVTKNPE